MGCNWRPCWGKEVEGNPSPADGSVEEYEFCPGSSCLCCLCCWFPFMLVDACALLPRVICGYQQADSIADVCCKKNVVAGLCWLLFCCNFQFKTHGLLLDNDWERGSGLCGVCALRWATHMFWCGNACFISHPEP